MKEYDDFLERKGQLVKNYGFEPVFMPDYLYDFQKDLVEWSLIKGRSAIFADCGLGKTPMQLVWAENIARKTNKPVLILTPLAVSHQTVREGEKFDISCERSNDGNFTKKIVITNYERLHYFDKNAFVGVVCDESSSIKHFTGKRQKAVTEFLKKIPYRLLCTATAAPNDYIELGTSSEALGELGYMDMLNMFFKNDRNTSDIKRHWLKTGSPPPKWRFKKHAEKSFWKWVCSFARALRKPSDLGYDNNGFELPPLYENETIVKASRPMPGKLFVEPATNLRDQREERKMTINERCDAVLEKINGYRQSLVWCQYNKEGDLLEKIIPGAIQLSGKDSDKKKEDVFLSFANGDLPVLITKPKIGAFGLNFQNCNFMTFFPSHSYEQYYQGVRRCWRFGQKNPVYVEIITTEGEVSVLQNLKRKSLQADRMFSLLTSLMAQSLKISTDKNFTERAMVPAWMN